MMNIHLVAVVVVLVVVVGGAGGVRRDEFPLDFVFGAGTSAYQYEGGAFEDGRAPTIWDTFTHAKHVAGRMLYNGTADVASDGYHKYKEDVNLMANTRLEAYRFSISWSRLIPDGRGGVNPKGLAYYNNVINELLKYGIEPHVTLLHLDLPQVLENEYGGWLSPKIVEDFTAYADVCFREFGDRVHHWTPLVEPNMISPVSYDFGELPPARCSYPFGINCNGGDSTTEPYVVTHNMLLAHASVVTLYRTKYKTAQKGFIGLNVYSYSFSPLTDSAADIQATKRAEDFYVGWLMSPLVFGDYPEIMRKVVGSRLPNFTQPMADQVKGSFDFIGLNFYASIYVAHNPIGWKSTVRDYFADMSCLITDSKDETPTSKFIPYRTLVYPHGMQHLLEYFKEAYGNPPIYVQENGYYDLLEKSKLNDTERVVYLETYIGSLLDALRNGSDVRGYFVWSFVDVFEFLGGYQTGMGLYHVDFNDKKRKRQPKLSAHWYAKFLGTKKNPKDIIRMKGLPETSYFQD